MSFRFTFPGQRIVRSVLAVWLCMLIYLLRGMHGDPYYSVIAALQCVQPYSSNMLREGRDRIIGTIIGVFWGAVILYLELFPVGSGLEKEVIRMILLGTFIGLVIYSTVLLNITKYALFAAMVFMTVAMYHLEDVNPYMHVIDRTIDTIIGVGVAFAVNSMHFPRVRDRETLFVSGMDDVLFREDRELTRYTKVELNRLLSEGMRFTFSTMQTPATVKEVLSEIQVHIPIIAMDGAVLYDMQSMRYILAEKMAPELVAQVTDYLHGEGIPFFVNTIQDDRLIIYFKDYKELLLEELMDGHHNRVAGEEPDFSLSRTAYVSLAKLYRKKHTSPYRYYVRTDDPVTENVIYLLVIDHEDNIDHLAAELKEQPWFSECRINFDTFDCDPGEKILRIYSVSATRAAMLEHLKERVGAEHTITFSSISSECDVFIEDPRHDRMVRELKKQFELVSLKGWRNILHL